MAGEDLYSALSGLNFTPMDSMYGIGAAGVGQSLPLLVNPYASTGKNLGMVLGGTLLSSLLGYQARRDANEQSMLTNRAALQMLATDDPAERLNIIENTDDSRRQERLFTLNSKLTEQNTLAKALAAQHIAQARAGLELEASPLGLQLAKAKAINAAQAEAAKLQEMDAYYQTPAGAAALERTIANQERLAKAQRIPIEEYTARKGVDFGYKSDLQAQQNEAALVRKNLELAARSGDKEADRVWKTKKNEIEQAFEKEMLVLRTEKGVSAAVERKALLDALEMENINNNQNPELAKINAKAEVARRTQIEIEEKRAQERKTLAEYLEAGRNARQDKSLGTLKVGELDEVMGAAKVATDLRGLAKEISDLSYPEIKAMMISGVNPPSKPGLLQSFERIQQLYRRPEFGATLTDNEKESSEMVFGKNLAGTKADILSALGSLSSSQFDKAELRVQGRIQGPGATLEAIQKARETGVLSFGAQPSQSSIESQIGKLEQISNDPNVSPETRSMAIAKINELLGQ